MTEAASTPAAPAEPGSAAFRRALRELMRLLQLRERVRVGAAGLTASGAHALELLAERGPLSLAAIAGGLFVDRSTACRTVGLLEDHGRVVRLPDPRDGRAIRVELTPAGRALEARLRAGAEHEAGLALAGFAPEERDAALAFLRRFTRASAADAGVEEPFA